MRVRFSHLSDTHKLQLTTYLMVLAAFSFIGIWSLFYSYNLLTSAPLWGKTPTEMIAIDFAAIVLFGNAASILLQYDLDRKGNHKIIT